MAKHTGKQLAKQEESNAPRTFASPLTRVRLDLLAPGVPVHLSRMTERALLLSGQVVLPQHSLEAEQAMAAELVACTLGARSRPELLPREPFA